MRRSLPAAFLLALLGSSPAFASYSCQGVPTHVTIDRSGNLVLSATGGLSWVYLCSVSSTENGVAPETCRGIHATLLTAYVSGSSVTFWFNDSLTCSTHPEWASLTGWYVGPTISPN